jgi:acetyl-CoA C-acetyltransferase
MSDIVIAAAKRTAIGSFLGQFNGVPTPTLGATAIAAALEQSGVPARRRVRGDHGLRAAGQPRPGARPPGGDAAGIPLSAGATTINKVCGSGMKPSCWP